MVFQRDPFGEVTSLMCGIAGTVGIDPLVSPQDLQRVAAILRHRGPDDHGVFLDGGCGLVHCRLSILDLSCAGHQPMQADELPVWITYNGEIYNYREVKHRLISLGWTFRSRTDTEVVLKGYLQWGAESFQYLRGMYALAIWDGRDRTLLLARDPFGIKPLFYTVLAKGQIVFASELKAILAFRGIQPTINPTALGQFFRYLYVPEPLSIYTGIQRLPAGATLVWKCGSISLKVAQRPSPSKPTKLHTGDSRQSSAWEEKLTATIRDSIAVHLVADVPVGAFLSGGVDSSLIVAIMRQLTSEELHTFSIVFSRKLKSFDESDFARSIAQRLGTCHHEISVDSSIAHTLENTLASYDEPFANPAALIADLLSEHTRRHVKVALSGIGGDEFFGGYPRYLAISWYSQFQRMPRSLLSLSGQILRMLPSSLDRKNTIARLRRLFAAALEPTARNFFDDLSAFAVPDVASSVIAPDFSETIAWRDPMRILGGTEQLSASWAMAVDASTCLPGDLLTYTDRSSMRYGLEVRTPFVDREVAALSGSIPESLTLRGPETKWLLKKVAANFIPRENIYRKKKGFSLPIGDWLKGELHKMTEEALQPSCLRDAPELNPRGVKILIDHLKVGDDSAAYRVWAVLIYVLWRRMRTRSKL